MIFETFPSIAEMRHTIAFSEQMLGWLQESRYTMQDPGFKIQEPGIRIQEQRSKISQYRQWFSLQRASLNTVIYAAISYRISPSIKIETLPIDFIPFFLKVMMARGMSSGTNGWATSPE